MACSENPPATTCEAHIGSALCRWEVQKQRRDLWEKVAPVFDGRPAAFFNPDAARAVGRLRLGGGNQFGKRESGDAAGAAECVAALQRPYLEPLRRGHGVRRSRPYSADAAIPTGLSPVERRAAAPPPPSGSRPAVRSDMIGTGAWRRARATFREKSRRLLSTNSRLRRSSAPSAPSARRSPAASASAYRRASAAENPHSEDTMAKRCRKGGGRSGSMPACRTAWISARTAAGPSHRRRPAIPAIRPGRPANPPKRP